jgi:hypothetical protein
MDRRYPLALLAALSFACGGDEASTPQHEGDGTGAGSSSGADDDDDGPGSASSESDADESSSSSGAPEPTFPIPATGISITDVEANEGVGVPIVAAGEWVDGASRNAELIKNRRMLVRAFWAIEPDFTPREITATLDLHYPDGTVESASRTVMVDGESSMTVLGQSFWFGLTEDLVRPQMQFQITLWEAEEGSLEEAQGEPAAFPDEPVYVGVEDPDMTLRVVLVPIEHDTGAGCPAAPIIDEAALAVFHDELYKQNPVSLVDITVRDPIVWQDSLNSFGGLLGHLAGLRDADGADPGAYYYGVVPPCDGGPDGVGGQAIDIPGFPSMGNGYSRVAVGRWYGQLGSTANTFVHEIGHTQGRQHVYCNGDEGGTTPAYPYLDGDIGCWGFDIVDFDTIFKPDVAKDYMTYCGNTWVSDWGWRQVVPYIREITSWDMQDAPPLDDGGRVLVGIVDGDDEDATWVLTRGDVGMRAPAVDDRIELVDEHGVRHDLAASLGAMGEGGYNLVVPVPTGVAIDKARSIARVRESGTMPIDEVKSAGQRLRIGAR